MRDEEHPSITANSTLCSVDGVLECGGVIVHSIADSAVLLRRNNR
jgi:hypothetical protein